jgi:hypothetical protein
MQCFKQFLYEKRALFTFLIMIYFLYETGHIIKGFFNGTATGFDIILSFFLVFFTLIGFCLIFVFQLTPYKRIIVQKRMIENEMIDLPKMYSFSESNEINIQIQYNKDDKNNDMIDLLEESDKPFSMLNLSHFNIKLLTEGNKELKTRIYPYLSGYYGIGIKLENKSDLKYVKKIKIQVSRPVEITIQQISYNGK